jgi:ABC-type transport system substrate-binding protein
MSEHGWDRLTAPRRGAAGGGRARPRVVVVSSLLAGWLLLAGCAASGPDDASRTPNGMGTSAPPPPPRPGGSLVVGIASDTDGFNPFMSQWSGPATQMARAVLDPLVVMDRDNHWQPYLAKTITSNANFTVWTFTLRPGVTFHNGEVLDADALVKFFEADVASPLTSRGFAEPPVIAKTDDMTVTLTFTQPWSEMPTVLADQPGYVIAPAQIASGDTKHPIGTGPFVFDEWVPDNHFVAHRNSSYWRTGLPYLDRIEFKPITDPTSREGALHSGDVDVADLGSVGQPKLDDLTQSGFRTIADVDNAGVIDLLMNTNRGPLKDKRIRQAIVEAIDRNDFRDTVLDASYEIADQPFPPASRWHTDVPYPAYDPDHAKQLVADYQAQNGPPMITILTVAAGPPRAAQYIQQTLKVIGITVSIDSVDVGRFIQLFITGNFDATYMGGFLFAPDPDGSYPFLIGKNAAPEAPFKLNFTEYRNDKVDDALEAQRRTDDETTRRAEWAKVWNALAADLPYAFLAHDRYALATRTDVYGLNGFTTPDGVALPAINHWTPFYTGVYRAAG